MPGTAGATGAAAPQRLVRARLSQAGRKLVFTLRTDPPLALGKLEPRPDTRRAASRYLCLALSRAGHAANGGSAWEGRGRATGSGSRRSTARASRSSRAGRERR